jgi:hypothetical protein
MLGHACEHGKAHAPSPERAAVDSHHPVTNVSLLAAGG